MPKITIVVTEEEKEAWVIAAHGEFISLAEWLRRAANARARTPAAAPGPTITAGGENGQSDKPAPPAPSVPAGPRAPQAAKTQGSKDGLCPHRVPIGSYCKRCEEEAAA